MSRISTMAKEEVRKQKDKETLRLDETHKNFMGGDCYNVNPLLKLKMITASSIFGEPQYYKNDKTEKRARFDFKIILSGLLFVEECAGKTPSKIMEEAIDEALDYDFEGTVNWAIELRNEFNMRTNPQVIMVRAAIHPKRAEINLEKQKDEATKDWFKKANLKVMRRADEPSVQMAYYLSINNGKVSRCPTILKKSWAEKIEGLDRYAIAKYKNAELGMINTIRVCHASKGHVPELMTTGTIKVEEDKKTWENLRSEGCRWEEILQTINMPHMARLRNIRGVATEITERDTIENYMQELKKGVPYGKQFPFRYWSAMKAVNGIQNQGVVLDGLEDCMDIALENMPKLKGKTMCLSDNSGSAWGAFTSEYGSVTVAEIDNLSSVITAMNSDEGYVGKFGDKLKVFDVRKRIGVLEQTKRITARQSNDVGGCTENGIWIFFRDAIDKKEHWDNIFIYSDQQAGHGGLYGTHGCLREYMQRGYDCKGHYINVFKLIEDYRRLVNPKVNVFCIQTAGYGDVLIPEYAYRTNILYGWTGKELKFADTMNKLWDEYDAEVSKNENCKIWN